MYAELAVNTLMKRIARQEYANMPAYKEVYQKHTLSMKLVIRDSTRGIGRGPFGERAASMEDLTIAEDEIQSIRQKRSRRRSPFIMPEKHGWNFIRREYETSLTGWGFL